MGGNNIRLHPWLIAAWSGQGQIAFPKGNTVSFDVTRTLQLLIFYLSLFLNREHYTWTLDVRSTDELQWVSSIRCTKFHLSRDLLVNSWQRWKQASFLKFIFWSFVRKIKEWLPVVVRENFVSKKRCFGNVDFRCTLSKFVHFSLLTIVVGGKYSWLMSRSLFTRVRFRGLGRNLDLIISSRE